MNKKFIIYLITLFAFIGVIGISVGFATYSKNLSIGEISAEVRAQTDIRINGFTVLETSPGVTVSNTEYNILNIFGDLNLPNYDSYAILDVDILNLGDVPMGINAINNLNSNLKYEIVNDSYTTAGYKSYKLKDILCDSTNIKLCKSGAESHVLVKISYADGEYNSNFTSYPLSLYFDFRRMYEVRAAEKFKEYLNCTLPSYIISGENLEVKIKNVEESRVLITEDNVILFLDTDYTITNQTITVSNISGDVLLGLNAIISNNVNLGTEWVDNYTVDITLNGETSAALYMRIYKGDLYITNVNGSKLYVEKYALNPVLPSDVNVYISFTPLSGTATLKGSFTVKLRDTETGCNQINTAELIANTPGKTNFYINSPGRNEGKLTTAAAFVSVYSAAGNKFDNFKFRVSYGKVS